MKILGHKTGRMFDHYADHVDKETFAIMTKAIEKGLQTEAADEKKEPIAFPIAAGK